jgi:hypothetical protein
MKEKKNKRQQRKKWQSNDARWRRVACGSMA